MLNVAAIMGRLTADPELKHTQSGIAMVRFTVAVDRSFVKAGAERQADFITVVAWRASAEFVCKYFRKGSMVAVDGSIQTGSYTDNNGGKRYTVEIMANNINFCGSKAESGSAPSRANDYQQQAPQASAYNEPASAYSSGSNEDFEEIIGDDDLPF
ncbi:MAG: single-stranded DNA-binding protein [Clostridia bacterium]